MKFKVLSPKFKDFKLGMNLEHIYLEQIINTTIFFFEKKKKTTSYHCIRQNVQPIRHIFLHCLLK